MLSEELAQLYHHVCLCNNETPNRVMLDYYRSVEQQHTVVLDLYTRTIIIHYRRNCNCVPEGDTVVDFRPIPLSQKKSYLV